jgi:hypothetical protein
MSSAIIKDPIAIAPNNILYHFSCYHEITRELRSHFHRVPRVIGTHAADWTSSQAPPLAQKGVISAEEFFRKENAFDSTKLRNADHLNINTLLSSNVFTSFASLSPLSLFASESSRRIEDAKGSLASTLPSLSSFFISKDNVFSSLLQNTPFLNPYPPSNLSNDNNRPAILPFELSPYLDEPMLANALSDSKSNHLPLSSVYPPPFLTNQNVVSAPAYTRKTSKAHTHGFTNMTSSLPYTEDSYLLEERDSLLEIAQISDQDQVVQEVSFVICRLLALKYDCLDRG